MAVGYQLISECISSYPPESAQAPKWCWDATAPGFRSWGPQGFYFGSAITAAGLAILVAPIFMKLFRKRPID